MNDGEILDMDIICSKVKEIYLDIQDIKNNKNT